MLTSPQSHWGLGPGLQDELAFRLPGELVQEGRFVVIGQQHVAVSSLEPLHRVSEAAQEDAERMLVTCCNHRKEELIPVISKTTSRLLIILLPLADLGRVWSVTL